MEIAQSLHDVETLWKIHENENLSSLPPPDRAP
jgi:hypothetical protein